MQGRIEHKIETENKIQEMISGMPDYIIQFYYYLNLKSHTTKLRYINNVIRFLNYYSNNDIYNLSLDKIKKINSFKIEQYIASINYYTVESKNEVKELSNASKAIIYSSLNAFFDYLVVNGDITVSPFSNKKIRRPKIQENDVVFLTVEEVQKVENSIIRGVGNKAAISKQQNWKFRDYLLFRIPVVNGLRVTALSEINIGDVELDKKRIRVTEKGNITKYVFIDDKTCMFIEMWMEKRKELLGNNNKEQALFISNQRKRMTVRSIEYIIEKYTKDIVPKHITPHKLRSTCGTNLYQAKKDIYLVANVLGHKTTAPTKRYTKVFEEDKQGAIHTIASLYDQKFV